MTAAELINHYADIRHRLYGKPTVINVIPRRVRVDPVLSPDPVAVIRKKHRSMRQIAELVCMWYGVTIDQLRGQSRMDVCVHPRQCAMYWMRRAGGWSYPQIGRFFGRDHTTVLHGVREHAKRRAARRASR